MKFKISHILKDILEDRRNLHASVPKMRKILLSLLGEEHFNEKNIRLSLLIHECISMVGISRIDEVEGKLDFAQELLTIFKKDEVTDPFMYTKYAITEESIEFQDKILAEEILNYEGNQPFLRVFLLIFIFR